jgi:Protein of unknown function (DUF1565)
MVCMGALDCCMMVFMRIYLAGLVLAVTACGKVAGTATPIDSAPGTDAPQLDAAQPDAPQLDAPQPDAPPLDAPQFDAMPPGIWVDSSIGDDSNPGNASHPFKTITRALSTAAAGDIVNVRPGTYGGETLPIKLPARVSLIGNEAGKGADTLIQGTNDAFAGGVVDPGAGATIAGFTLANMSVSGSGMNITVATDAVIIRNNTMSNPAHVHIYVNAGTNVKILDNKLSGAGSVGIAVVSNGTGMAQGNVIVSNQYGIEVDSGTFDAGGGSFGSTGGNTLSCNTNHDTYGMFAARNDLWDHVPPTTADFTNGTPDTTGARLAPNPCP